MKFRTNAQRGAVFAKLKAGGQLGFPKMRVRKPKVARSYKSELDALRTGMTSSTNPAQHPMLDALKEYDVV